MLYLRQKKRLIELKKEFAHEIATHDDDFSKIPEKEQLEILSVLKLHKNMIGNINDFFDIVSQSDTPGADSVLSVITLLARIDSLLRSLLKVKEVTDTEKSETKSIDQAIDDIIDDIIKDL